MNGGIKSVILGNGKNAILKVLQGIISSSCPIIRCSTTWKRAVATKGQISCCFVWINLSKDRISQPVWQEIPVLLVKILFHLSDFWNCFVWLFSLLCCLTLPRGVWWWCPKNYTSNSCKQILNTSVISPLPKLLGPTPSASLHVCLYVCYAPLLDLSNFLCIHQKTEGFPRLIQH